MTLSMFDCNCMVGKRADRKESEPWDLETLARDMRHSGIGEALVTHAMSRDYDPATGNRELESLVSGQTGLHGCWALLPPASRELPSPEMIAPAMFHARMTAMVAYPRLHNYSLADWSLGPLLKALASHRIPLLLPFGQCTWEEVDQLCGKHFSLPVIITGLNYRQLRFLLPLWEKHRYLFVDLSWLSVHDGLSFLAERGLLQHVLFGTNYPLYDPGAAVAMVTYANLSTDDRESVAGGTLRTILRNIRRDGL
jgi:predicted TIM-barrel fold metal-dependent hydrolase